MAATIELGKGLLIFSPTTPAQIVIRRALRRVGCATPALPVPVANGEPGTGVNGPATEPRQLPWTSEAWQLCLRHNQRYGRG